MLKFIKKLFKKKATEEEIRKNRDVVLAEKPGYYKFLNNQRLKYIGKHLDEPDELNLFLEEYLKLFSFYDELNKAALKNDDLALDIFKENIPKKLLEEKPNSFDLKENPAEWISNYKFLRNVIRKLKLRYGI